LSATIAHGALMVHFLAAMSAAPDPAELAPSRDPAAYGRRPLSGSSFLIWVVLCVLCLVVGAAIGHFAFPTPSVVGPETPAAPDSAARGPLVSSAPSNAPVTAPVTSSTATPAGGDAALGERVARLESASARQGQVAAQALAAASLSVAAQGSAPFERDLAAYEPLAPDDPDLRALIPLAEQGAPSRAALAASLPDFAAAAVVAARAPSNEAGFLAKLWALIGRVVIVRNVDPAAPGLDGVLARAQGQASAGDTEAAVQTLKRLPPVARAQLGEWLAAAERRIEIDQRVAALRARALAALAPAPAGQTATP
jgi:hypothetical protein